MAATDLTGTDPDFARRYTAAAAEIETALGISMRIVSGYRSNAEQQRLYDAWRKRQAGVPGYGWANPAAKPGTSNHNRGLALDIAPNSDVAPGIVPIFARYGLHFPLRHLASMHEPWHLEPMSVRGLPMPPIPNPNPPAPDPEEQLLMDVTEIIAGVKAEIRAAGPRGRLGGWYHDRATGTEWVLTAGPAGPVNVFPQNPGVLKAMADRGDIDPSPLKVDGPVAAEMWRLWGAPA